MAMMSHWFANGRGRSGLFLIACTLLLVSERILDGQSTLSLACTAAGAGTVLVALILRLWSSFKGAQALRPVEIKLLHCQLLATLGLLLYGLQQTLFSDTDSQLLALGLKLGWPILWFTGSVAMLVLDFAADAMRLAGAVESRRITAASRAGLTVGLALCLLFVVNFLATRHNEYKDWAYFQTARPGTATINVVKHLDEPVEVLLFFPRANDVAERVLGYLGPLEKASQQLKVQVLDRLLNPVQARKHRVRQDGTIVIARGKRRDSWSLKTDLKKARRQLTKIDQEFFKRLIKVTAKKRIAYFVTGHGEINEAVADDGTRLAKKDRVLREVLGYLGYSVKNLGGGQGLANKVPNDADLVLILGPTEPFLPGESEALVSYLEGGGRVLIGLEPKGQALPTNLATLLGVQLVKETVVHSRFHLRRNFDLSDRELIVSTSFSSHPSVKTLSRATRKVAVAFDRVGHLEKGVGKGGPAKRKVDFTVRSIADSWADKNGDREFNKDSEKRRVYNLAAAISLPSADSADKNGDGRAIVVADSGLFSDEFMRSRGNLFLLNDSLRYLQGQEALAGTIESEEDKPLVHTRDDDVVWFYGTIFFVPMMVLGLGLAYLRRRRRSFAKKSNGKGHGS
jgi:hypothetical protein